MHHGDIEREVSNPGEEWEVVSYHRLSTVFICYLITISPPPGIPYPQALENAVDSYGDRYRVRKIPVLGGNETKRKRFLVSEKSWRARYEFLQNSGPRPPPEKKGEVRRYTRKGGKTLAGMYF